MEEVQREASSSVIDSEPAKNKRSPSEFLKSVLGRPVKVRLNSGIEYRGMHTN